MGQIISGTIKFGRTVKTGDYESKRGDVELTFTIPEGEDPAATLDAVSQEAQERLKKILGIRVAGAAPVEANARGEAPKTGATPASAPVTLGRTKADLEREATAAAIAPKRGPGRPPKPPAPTAAALAPKVDIEAIEETPAPAVDELEDLGGPVPVVITDKELTDAANRVNQRTKQTAAIRALNAKHGGGPVPKGLRDMPQANRAAYLKELNAM